MIKVFLWLIIGIIASFVLSATSPVLARDIDPTSGELCQLGVDVCLNGPDGQAYECIKDCAPDINGIKFCFCEPSPVKGAFGTIKLPGPLAGFLKNDPTGAGAISDFLSRLIILIYSLAAIVLIFMIIWGAFEWLTSGGDKEAIAKASGRILNAFIGILLFAVAFAIITVIGQFTGFRF